MAASCQQVLPPVATLDTTATSSKCRLKLSSDPILSFLSNITKCTAKELDDEEYQCPCGRRFSRKAPFQRHMDLVHSNTESYKCKTCGKTFGNLNTLTMHMSVHNHTNQSSFETMENPKVKKSVKSAVKTPRVKKSDEPECSLDNNNTLVNPEKTVAAPITNVTIDGSVVTVQPMDTIKEESDKENVDEIKQQQVLIAEPINIPQISSDHVVIKLQKGVSSQMVTLPLVMSTSSPHQISQVYTIPSTDNEDAKVRKSARLTGKVPGWKTFIHDEQQQQQQQQPQQQQPQQQQQQQHDVMKTRKRKTRATSEETDSDCTSDDVEEALKRQRIGKEDFPCEVCGKSFTSEKYLSMHSALHGAQNPADDLMTEDFKEQDGYIKSGNTWMCKICSKVFAQNSSFKNHMRTHSDERPYVCQVCSIGFKERYHLKKHQLFKHSTELKEKCRFCGKRFKDSTAVRAHERIHSEERPYSCRRCNKAFKTSECLWHHENRSKTCGQVAQTYPPAQRGRRGRPARTKLEKEVPPATTTTLLMPVQQSPMHVSPHLVASQQIQQQIQVQAHPMQHQTIKTAVVKSEPLSEEEYLEELDLVNEVIESVETTSNMESILKDVEDGPLLNDDGELLLPSESEIPVTSSELTATISYTSSSEPTEHIVTQPEHIVSQSGHIVTQSGHIVTQSGHIVTQPGHIVTQSGHIVTQSGQIVTQPGHIVTQPAHIVTQTGHIVTHPEHSVTQTGHIVTQPGNLVTQPALVVTSPMISSTSQNPVRQQVVTHPYTVTVNPSTLQQPQQTIVSAQPVKPASQSNQISNESVIQAICQANHQPSTIVSLPTKPLTVLSKPSSLPTPRPIPTAQVSGDITRPVATVQPVQRVIPIKKEIKQELSITEQQLKSKMSNFTCPKCFKGFAVQSAFNKHLQRHEEVQPFHCGICDLGFKLKVHLKKHNLYRHSSEYPCECKICGKKFKDSSAVRLHERIHSEARPFKCGCGKTFKTKENLWGHQHRKMCPMASDNSSDCPVKAEAVLGGHHVTASIKDNQIIAQAVVSNNKVTAQATIGNNGELTAHASVISNSKYISQASFNSSGAEIKVENPECSDVIGSPSTLPSFETFSSVIRSPTSPSAKKESLADKCPTIQNLLRKAPTTTTKLPGIQQLFQAHMKPPPPYPGKQLISPPPSPYSSAPSQLMINPDQMYESSRGPYLRTPPPQPYKDPSSSPYSDFSPGSSHTPGTPGSSSCSSDMPTILWDDDIDRKPVVTQWQHQDPDTLFHELSSTVLNQL